jgi:hypothetical protein
MLIRLKLFPLEQVSKYYLACARKGVPTPKGAGYDLSALPVLACPRAAGAQRVKGY